MSIFEEVQSIVEHASESERVVFVKSSTLCWLNIFWDGVRVGYAFPSEVDGGWTVVLKLGLGAPRDVSSTYLTQEMAMDRARRELV